MKKLLRQKLVLLLIIINSHTLFAETESHDDVCRQVNSIYQTKQALPVLDYNGPLSKRYEKLLIQQGDYLISKLHPWKKDPKAFLLTKGYSDEHNIRPNAHTAFGLAIIDRCIQNRSGKQYGENAISILRFLLATHGVGDETCNNNSKWHNQWQSALWASSAGQAAWLLWDDLDDQMKWMAARMICDEADRFVGKTPPTQIKDDTKAEENAWNAKVIALAYNMFPNHPRHDVYGQTAIQWAVTAYASENDACSDKIVDGKPLNKWLTGGNVYDDYTCENHGFVHPGYMAAYGQNVYLDTIYQWGNNPTPEAAFFNAEHVYANLKIFQYPDGCYCFPSGQDWTLRRHFYMLRLHAAHSVIFKDSQAAALELCGLETLEKMAQRDNATQGILKREEFFFASTQHFALEMLGYAYLLHRSNGEGIAPVSSQQLLQQLSGNYIFNEGKIALIRTEKSISTFSWGKKLMGIVMPLADDLIVSPYNYSMIGTMKVDGFDGQKTVMNNMKVVKLGDDFGICGSVWRSRGAAKQNFAYIALADGRTIYIGQVYPDKGPEIESLSLGTIALLNDPVWVYSNGTRTLYYENGSNTFAADGNEPEKYNFNSNWYNIDNKLGIIPLLATGSQQYVANHKRKGARIEQYFHLNSIDVDDVAKWPVETAVVYYPGENSDMTRLASTKCKLKKESVAAFNLCLDDGTVIIVDLNGQSISIEKQ